MSITVLDSSLDEYILDSKYQLEPDFPLTKLKPELTYGGFYESYKPEKERFKIFNSFIHFQTSELPFSLHKVGHWSFFRVAHLDMSGS